MNMKNITIAALAAMCAANFAFAGKVLTDEEKDAIHSANIERAKALVAADAEGQRVGDGVLVKSFEDGAKYIEFYAESTIIDKGGIIEFPIVSLDSSRDYEALFMAFASPEDIAKGMEMIGAKPGVPVDYGKLEFWSMGERAYITACSVDDKAGVCRPISVFTRKPPESKYVGDPFRHVVYIASKRGADGKLAAMTDGIGSIVSAYNEVDTIFDVDCRAAQGDFYGMLTAAPDLTGEYGVLYRISVQMERRTAEQGPRVRNVEWEIGNNLNLADDGSGSGRPPYESPSYIGLGKDSARAKEYDIFVRLDFAEDLALANANAFAKLLGSADGSVVKVRGPKDGQLYYMAFNPPEAWRPREGRPTQPCELRFKRGEDGKLSATMVKLTEIFSEDSDSWRPSGINAEEFPVASPQEFAETFAKHGGDIKVILVFAPGDATAGELTSYVRAVPELMVNAHIFIEN